MLKIIDVEYVSHDTIKNKQYVVDAFFELRIRS